MYISYLSPSGLRQTDVSHKSAMIFIPIPPPRQTYTNFILYPFVIQRCSTNWLGHGHRYEWHSSRKTDICRQCAISAKVCLWGDSGVALIFPFPGVIVVPCLVWSLFLSLWHGLENPSEKIMLLVFILLLIMIVILGMSAGALLGSSPLFPRTDERVDRVRESGGQVVVVPFPMLGALWIGSSGMWCSRMWGLKIISYWPSTTEGVGTSHLKLI